MKNFLKKIYCFFFKKHNLIDDYPLLDSIDQDYMQYACELYEAGECTKESLDDLWETLFDCEVEDRKPSIMGMTHMLQDIQK